MLAKIIFVVWRRGLDALLVIGIAQAWLRQTSASAVRTYRWGAVAAAPATAAATSFAPARLDDAARPARSGIATLKDHTISPDRTTWLGSWGGIAITCRHQIQRHAHA